MEPEPEAPVTDGAQRKERTALPPLATVHLDLDGARHIFRLHGWTWRGTTDPVYATGVPHALDAFDRFGIRATFFVIAEDLDDPVKAESLNEIVRRGHDVASHSMTHATLRGLDAASKRREIAGSRDRIGNALGITPAGFRAPYFSIDAESLDIAADAGYAWDSSVMAGRAVPGLNAATTAARLPWRVRDDRALVELPLPPYRPLPFPFHPSYSLVLGFRYFSLGLARQRPGSPLVLLFHLIDFSDPLPAALLRGVRQRIFTLSHIDAARKRAACRRMLDAVRRSRSIVDTATLLGSVSDRAGRTH